MPHPSLPIDQGSWYLQEIANLGDFSITSVPGGHVISAAGASWQVHELSLQALMEAYVGIRANIVGNATLRMRPGGHPR